MMAELDGERVNEPSLDDQLKQAQIAKTNAETKKLDKEAETVKANAKSEFWSEAIKILGGIVLGIGGVTVAYTQYEVSELKAKIAKEELSKAQDAKVAAEKAKLAAEAAASSAMAKRDQAVREQRDAEAAVAELKTTLTQTNNELKTAKPSEHKERLAFIQFRGDLTREVINELRTSLARKAFNAPGAERVNGEYQNLVKYFKSNESADAEELGSAVEAFFASKGCPIKMRVVPATKASAVSPPLEVWLALKCNGR
jgi:multidrug efflux pump subunit AcrA (membrane-fusion protein)